MRHLLPSRIRFFCLPDEYFSKQVSSLPPEWNGLRKGQERNVQVCGFNGFQKRLGHRLVNAIPSHRLTGVDGQLRMRLIAFVDQQGVTLLFGAKQTLRWLKPINRYNVAVIGFFPS